MCSDKMKPHLFSVMKTFIYFYAVFQLCHTEGLAIKQQCGFPGAPKFGNVKPDLNLYSSGSLVTYSCRVGHILLGSPINRCDDSGEWTADIPICDDSMTTLGVASSSQTVPGHPAEMAIDRNKETCTYLIKRIPRWWRIDLGGEFKVLSVSITMISPDKFVKFIVSVIKIHGISSDYQRCASFSGKFGTPTILLSCADGKGIEGQRVHIEVHALTEGLLEICEVEVQVKKDTGYDCGRPDRSTHSINFEPEDNKVHYGCDVGYELQGHSIRRCMPTGQWSGEAPECKAIICDKLGPLENGQLKLSAIDDDEVALAGSIANYNCDYGFKLIGDFSRICYKDGSWSGKAPHCEAIRCQVPDGKEQGGVYRLVNHTTRMGSMALLKCKKSKREGDNPFILCTEEGEWTEPESRCLTPLNRIANAAADRPKIAKKGVVIFGMVVAALMMTIVFVALFVVMKRRRNANKPELPSRLADQPEAPPRPPPRSKGTFAASFVDCMGRGTKENAKFPDSTNENESSWKTRSLPQNRDEIMRQDSIPVRAVSFEQSLRVNEDHPNSPNEAETENNEEIEEEDSVDAQSTGEKESSAKDTDESRSPTPKTATTGVPYAAVDYEKKRESRLLKDSSEDVNTTQEIEPEKDDKMPPTLPPKEKDESKTKNKVPGKTSIEETDKTEKENRKDKLDKTPSESTSEKQTDDPAESDDKTTKRTRRIRGQIDNVPEEKEDQRPSWRRTRPK